MNQTLGDCILPVECPSIFLGPAMNALSDLFFYFGETRDAQWLLTLKNYRTSEWLH